MHFKTIQKFPVLMSKSDVLKAGRECELSVKLFLRLFLFRPIHPTSISGQCHMNLTPIPLGLCSSSQTQIFDHTTWATTSKWPEGPLTVIRNFSSGHSGLGQQINAPWVLRFFVSPSMVPSAVIAEIVHLISALGYIRFSSPFILAPMH